MLPSISEMWIGALSLIVHRGLSGYYGCRKSGVIDRASCHGGALQCRHLLNAIGDIKPQ